MICTRPFIGPTFSHVVTVAAGERVAADDPLVQEYADRCRKPAQEELDAEAEPQEAEAS